MAQADEPSPTVWREGDLVVARRDLGVPLVTVGGFVPLMATALGSYYIMPHVTVRLKPERIDDQHIWLAGAAPEYLAQLPERTKPSVQVRG
jgi:hypothetical protein